MFHIFFIGLPTETTIAKRCNDTEKEITEHRNLVNEKSIVVATI